MSVDLVYHLHKLTKLNNFEKLDELEEIKRLNPNTEISLYMYIRNIFLLNYMSRFMRL